MINRLFDAYAFRLSGGGPIGRKCPQKQAMSVPHLTSVWNSRFEIARACSTAVLPWPRAGSAARDACIPVTLTRPHATLLTNGVDVVTALTATAKPGANAPCETACDAPSNKPHRGPRMGIRRP